MIPHDDRALSELTFVAFDVETTGLDPQADRIVEVGATRFGREGSRGEYQRLINPGCPIPPDATAIHGITSADVGSSPPIGAALPEVSDFFGDSVLVAHNAPFDMGFFDAAFSQADKEPLPNPVICTLQLARATFPGLAGYGLETLVRTLGIPEGTHHRALADALQSAEVFRRCIESTEAGWGMSFGDLLKRHGPALRFGGIAGEGIPAQALEMIKAAMKDRSTVRIEYLGGNGKITVREITPSSINESGRRIRVAAFCHLRGERRTFHLDRIKKIG